MKITGGQARGLRIDAPPGNKTRPTTDRVRESLFGILRDLVPEAQVLDLYAGSGALGLEAASRGAKSVVWIEKHPPAARIIEANFKTLTPAGVATGGEIVVQDVCAWLRRCSAAEETADLIFADPPYEQMMDEDQRNTLLHLLWKSRILKKDGLLVLELSRRVRPELPPEWTVLRKETYGGTCIWFLDRQENAEKTHQVRGDQGVNG